MISFVIVALAISLAIAAAFYTARHDGATTRRPPTSHRTDLDFVPPARRG